jgi:hypothetical protein
MWHSYHLSFYIWDYSVKTGMIDGFFLCFCQVSLNCPADASVYRGLAGINSAFGSNKFHVSIEVIIMKSINKYWAKCLLVTAISGLVACGGSSDTADDGSATMGSFSLALTDGPVDSANQVVVEFSGVSIKPANGEAIEFLFDEPQQIDLLQLQGSASAAIITDELVPAGAYEWIRLHVNAEHDGVLDSFIELGDGSQLELRVPSGSQTGLKLVTGFTVAAGGGVDFTIDFDLRKSVTNPPGLSGAILKPALRLIDNLAVGSISGVVDSNLVAQECVDAGVSAGAVYVYSGADVVPVDMQGTDTDPLTSALVSFGETNEYIYELGFLPAGSYTVAYTCGSTDDNPEAVDLIEFVGTANVSVVAGIQAEYDFFITE